MTRLLSLLFLLLNANNSLRAYATDQSADLVIGQMNTASSTINQGLGLHTPAANTLFNPWGVQYDGTRLVVTDYQNSRVLLYNALPVSNNASANVVVGQASMAGGWQNQDGTTVSAKTLYDPVNAFSDGTRLYVPDTQNNRVLIFNSIPSSNDAAADVVVGQSSMAGSAFNQGQGDVPAANTLWTPQGVYSDGTRLFVADSGNNRILIFNSIPTSDNASADLVIGQPNMSSNLPGTDAPAANTLSGPSALASDGTRLYVADHNANRVLIYDSIPTTNNASADVVLGQPDMSSTSGNQGGSPAAYTLYGPSGVGTFGSHLWVVDSENSRVLIFNSIPSANDVSADAAVGQPDLVSGSEDQGGTAEPNDLYLPQSAFATVNQLFVGDWSNNRVLIFDAPSSTPSFTASPSATISPTFTPSPSNTVSPTMTVSPSASPTASPSPSPTCTPTATGSATATPSPSASPSPSPTATYCSPTITPTLGFGRSTLGKTVWAPVPVACGDPLTLYFDRTPKSSSLRMYSSGGQEVADEAFPGPVASFGTADLAPGVYFMLTQISYEDQSSVTAFQKVIVVK